MFIYLFIITVNGCYFYQQSSSLEIASYGTRVRLEDNTIWFVYKHIQIYTFKGPFKRYITPTRGREGVAKCDSPILIVLKMVKSVT